MAKSISYELKAVTTDSGLAYLELAASAATTPEPPSGHELPVVLVLHGLRSQKENALKAAYLFAAAGFRVITPDLAMHGERVGRAERDALLASAYTATVLEIIQGSVADTARLLDELGVEKAAVHGLSLGGIVAFAALLDEPRLAVTSVALGSPDWLGLNQQLGPPTDAATAQAIYRMSPLTRAEAMAPRPILMLHGDRDEVVPVTGVQALNEKLAPIYKGLDCSERLEMVIYEGLGHVYTDDMINRSIAWTQRFIDGNRA